MAKSEAFSTSPGQAAGTVNEREFPFTEADFQQVRTLLYRFAGIHLAEYKTDMVYNRLVRRLRALGLTSFDHYLGYLNQHSDEHGHFINAMTTNLTAFYRESHHFDYISQQFLPELALKGRRQLKIWSSACSMGEEPYSIAMSLRQGKVDTSDWDIRILATDIDTQVLSTAARGIYSAERVDGLPVAVRHSAFLKGRGEQRGKVRIKPELQQQVKFRQLNLLDEWPIKGPLDMIFCRNVMIYFDKKTQTRLLDRMASLLEPGGLLFVGHSESPARLNRGFRLLGRTIYQKV